MRQAPLPSLGPYLECNDRSGIYPISFGGVRGDWDGGRSIVSIKEERCVDRVDTIFRASLLRSDDDDDVDGEGRLTLLYYYCVALYWRTWPQEVRRGIEVHYHMRLRLYFDLLCVSETCYIYITSPISADKKGCMIDLPSPTA